MRVFISIKFPTKVLMNVKEIQERLPEFIGKPTEIKNLHLTLKFLGEINSSKLEEVKSRLNKINFSKFQAEINDIGFFDNPNQGIIWLGIKNCIELQKEIDFCLEGLFKRESRFMGHLTIARVRKVADKNKFLEDLKKIKIPKMVFFIEGFHLIESVLRKEGPEYKTIKDYSLK